MRFGDREHTVRTQHLSEGTGAGLLRLSVENKNPFEGSRCEDALRGERRTNVTAALYRPANQGNLGPPGVPALIQVVV